VANAAQPALQQSNLLNWLWGKALAEWI